jgi:hypothetical protein
LSVTCRRLTISTTNINDLLQVTDNLFYKHQWPAASHWKSLLQTSMTCCKSLTIFTTNINDLLQVNDNLYYKHQWPASSHYQSLVLCVCFVDRCLFFCTYSFGDCVVCSVSIYRFWLSVWFLQTLLYKIVLYLSMFWLY